MCAAVQNDQLVETSALGTVLNGLSHLPGCRHRSEFVVGLLRGFAGNIATDANRVQFAKQLFEQCDERVPDPTRPLDTYYSPGTSAPHCSTLSFNQITQLSHAIRN